MKYLNPKSEENSLVNKLDSTCAVSLSFKFRAFAMNMKSSCVTKFKMKVIIEAKKKTINSVAARLFGVNERQVNECKKQEYYQRHILEKKKLSSKNSKFPILKEILNI